MHWFLRTLLFFLRCLKNLFLWNILLLWNIYKVCTLLTFSCMASLCEVELKNNLQRTVHILSLYHILADLQRPTIITLNVTQITLPFSGINLNLDISCTCQIKRPPNWEVKMHLHSNGFEWYKGWVRKPTFKFFPFFLHCVLGK